jgi:hypothetical protein
MANSSQAVTIIVSQTSYSTSCHVQVMNYYLNYLFHGSFVIWINDFYSNYFQEDDLLYMELFKLPIQTLIKIDSMVKSYLVDEYEDWSSLLSYYSMNFDGRQ